MPSVRVDLGLGEGCLRVGCGEANMAKDLGK